MQKRLDDLKRIAVMSPTDANLLAYMRYQRFVMDKSEVFAERWQRLVWTVPELDYGLTGRPTNAMAVGVFDQQRQELQAQRIRHRVRPTEGPVEIHDSALVTRLLDEETEDILRLARPDRETAERYRKASRIALRWIRNYVDLDFRSLGTYSRAELERIATD